MSAAKGLALAPDPIALQLVQQLPSQVLSPVWSIFATLSGARHSAAVSTDGSRIYVSLGFSATTSAVSGFLTVIDAATGVQTAGPSASLARLGAAGVFCNGSHYAIGGDNGTTVYSQVDMYTPGGTTGASGAWASRTTVANRTRAAAAAIGNFIYLAGGASTLSGGAPSGAEATLYRFDTVNNTWATLATMPAGRREGALVALGTKLYYIGGINSAGNQAGTAYYVYDTVGGTWVTLNHPGNLAGVSQGTVLGNTAYFYSSSGVPYAFDLLTGTYVLLVGPSVSQTSYPGLVLVGSNLYLISGSTANANVTRLDTTAVTELAPNAWQTLMAYSAINGRAVTSDGTRVYTTHGMINGNTTVTAGGSSFSADGTFATMPTASTARYGVASAWCNGRHWVMGGLSATNVVTVGCEAYTPAGVDGGSGTWSAVSNLPSARGWASAAAVGQFIYFAGGNTADGTGASSATAILLRYDTTTGVWATLGAMPGQRTQGMMAAFGTRLFFFGGLDSSGTQTSTVYIYDTAAGAWSTGTPMATGTLSKGMAAVVGNFIYLYGFSSTLGGHVARRFDPATQITSGGEVPVPNSHGDYAGLAGIGSRVYLVSGVASSNLDVLDPNYIAPYVRKLRSAKSYFAATDPVLASAVAQIPETMPTSGWLASGSHPSIISGCAVATDGTNIYTSHGITNGGFNQQNGYVITPNGVVTGITTAATLPRNGVAGAWLNGRFLAMGGIAGSTVYQVVEAYTPAGAGGNTGSWSTLATMTFRAYASAAVAGNFLYVAGGQNGSGVASAVQTLQRFDGTTWTALTAMPAVRSQGAMAALGTKLYYMGGVDGAGSAQSTVYVYDIPTGTWSTGPAMPATGAYSPAVVVNGQIHYLRATGARFIFDGTQWTTDTATTTAFHGSHPGAVAINSTIHFIAGTDTANIDRIDAVSGPRFNRDIGFMRQLALAGSV